MIRYCSVTKQWLLPASPSIHVLITMSSGHEPFGNSQWTPKIMSGLLGSQSVHVIFKSNHCPKAKVSGMIFRRRHNYFTATYEFLFLYKDKTDQDQRQTRKKQLKKETNFQAWKCWCPWKWLSYATNYIAEMVTWG